MLLSNESFCEVSEKLSNGQGITDSTLTRWILSFSIAMKITEALEKFYVKRFLSFELRSSRQLRDNSDLMKLSDWFWFYNPFWESVPRNIIMNITTGFELLTIKATMTRKKKWVKLYNLTWLVVLSERERKKKLVSISTTNNTTKIKGEVMTINSLQLSRRIATVLQSNENLHEHLLY